MRVRLRREDGIALVLALAMSIALAALIVGVTTYIVANQRSATRSTKDTVARAYAEAALDQAYSRLVYSNTSAGKLAGLNASKPNLLGCVAAQGNDGSDCSSPTPVCVAFTGTCPSGTYTPTAGTASVYGFYTGTSPAANATFSTISEQSQEWILVATGYAQNSTASLDAKTLKATVLISAGGQGAVASVWNHVFLTKAAPNSTTCTQTISGNGLVWDAPLYVIGNLCLNGNNDYIKEVTGGQKIDLQVGGKLVLAGSGNSASTVGDWSTSPVTPITQGVVVGGCASSIANAGTDCASNFKYSVGAVGTFISQNDPELTTQQIENDYATFDPGPLHTCQSGTSPSPLSDATFDNSVSSSERTTPTTTTTWLPDNTGSSSTGGVFDVTPAYNYACISKNGTGTGYLIWNNNSTGSITVSGITVPARTLAIKGSIFLDSPVTIDQSLTYAGTGIIMAAGQITLTGNSQTICAQNTSCVFTNWQGQTNNTDMLTLATLLQNSTTAINFTGQQQTYQGSMWTPTTSQVAYSGNGYSIQGPLSAGGLNIIANTFSFKPLPVITNMPLGAPVPPNVSVTINPMTIIG